MFQFDGSKAAQSGAGARQFGTPLKDHNGGVIPCEDALVPTLVLQKFAPKLHLDFGEVMYGTHTTRQLRVRNPAPAAQTLKVDSIGRGFAVTVNDNDNDNGNEDDHENDEADTIAMLVGQLPQSVATITVQGDSEVSLLVHWLPPVSAAAKAGSGNGSQGVRSKLVLRWTRMVKMEVVMVGRAISGLLHVDNSSNTCRKPARQRAGKAGGKGGRVGKYSHIRAKVTVFDKENSKATNGGSGAVRPLRAALKRARREHQRLEESLAAVNNSNNSRKNGSQATAGKRRPSIATLRARAKREQMQAQEGWAARQERGFTQWLNHVLCGGGSDASNNNNNSNSNESDSQQQQQQQQQHTPTLAELYDRRAESAASEAVHRLYASRGVREVLLKVHQAIEAGRIAAKKGRDVASNVETRRRLLSLLLCYHPAWLCAGLSAIHTHDLGASFRLRASEQQQIPAQLKGQSREAARAAVLLKAFLFPQEQEHLAAISAQAARRRNQVLVQKFLNLVYLLDRAKTEKLLPTDPCLFVENSKHLSSASLLTAFSAESLSEGDVVRHLHLMGYRLSHTQHKLDSFNFHVDCLGTALRDGIRLARLADLLAASKQGNNSDSNDSSSSSNSDTAPRLLTRLRLPADTFEKRVFNVNLALKALRAPLSKEHARIRAGVTTAEDIVKGHQTKTLALLWDIILRWDVASMVNGIDLESEIDRLTALAPTRSEQLHATYMQSPQLQNLLRWFQAVLCAQAPHIGGELKVTNFTSSLKDGRALCALLSYYHPSLLPLADVAMDIGKDAVARAARENKQKQSSSCSESVESPSPVQQRKGSSGWSMSMSFETVMKEDEDSDENKARRNFARLNACVQQLGHLPVLLSARDMVTQTPDEKVVITFVTYLCSRLLPLSAEIHACMRIQRAWRRFLAVRQLRTLQTQAEIKRKIEEQRARFLAKQRTAAEKREAARVQAAKEEAERKEREEAARKAREEAERLAAEEAERRRQEERARKEAEEADRKRQEEAIKRRAEEEAARIAAELAELQAREEAERQAEEAARVAAEQAAIKAQQEAERRAREEAARLAKEEAERQAREEAERKRAYEALVLRSAITLQCFARRILARRRLSELRQEKEAALIIQLRQHQAATRIQATARAFVARTRFLAARHAAVKIQAQVRRRACMHAYQHTLRTRHSAATKLQAVARGRIQRRQFQQLIARRNRAVITLQAMARRVIAQRHYRAVMQARHSAATKAQAAFRGHAQRRRYRALLRQREGAAVLIQATARGFVARRRHLRVVAARHAAATVLQARARGMAERRRYRNTLKRREDAAVRLQAVVRGRSKRKQYRLLLQRRQACAVTIQRVARGKLARRRVDGLRKARDQQRWAAAVRVQAHARGWIQRRRFAHLLAVRGAAALRVQTCYRGYVARKGYSALLAARNQAACAIQAMVRGRQQRARYVAVLARRERAAVKLQSAVRAWRARRSYAALVASRERAAVRIQAVVKGRQQRARYMALLARRQVAAVKLQAAYRAFSARRQYTALLARREAAAVSIQAAVRGRQQRARYTALVARRHTAATLIQAHVRGLCARRRYQLVLDQRTRAAITLQCFARVLLAQQTLRRMKQAKREQDARRARAAVALQSVWRGRRARKLRARLAAEKAFRESVEFARASAAARLIQRCARVWLARRMAVRREAAARLIQNVVRVWLGRRAAEKRKRAILVVQSVWRGRRVRRKCSKRLRDLRKRLCRATRKVRQDPSQQVGMRTQSALHTVLHSKSLSVVSHAVQDLEAVTRVLPQCCADAVDKGVIPALYNLIWRCNRSKPHVVVVTSCLDILLHVGKHPPSMPHVFDGGDRDCAEVLVEQMTVYGDLPVVFGKLASLLLLGAKEIIGFAQGAKTQAETMRKLSGARRLHTRKVQLLLKSGGGGSSSRAVGPQAAAKQEKRRLMVANQKRMDRLAEIMLDEAPSASPPEGAGSSSSSSSSSTSSSGAVTSRQRRSSLVAGSAASARRQSTAFLKRPLRRSSVTTTAAAKPASVSASTSASVSRKGRRRAPPAAAAHRRRAESAATKRK